MRGVYQDQRGGSGFISGYCSGGQRFLSAADNQDQHRAGRKTEILQAFFEMYEVPLEDQMVPIVFTARGYLAGYEAISSGLYTEMEQGAGLWMKYPSEKGIFK